ncbi:MAG: type II CAAX endopeptidase family protein [Desulfosalsimonadaceae bacterium]
MNLLAFILSLGSVLAVEAVVAFAHISHPLAATGLARCIETALILLIFYVPKPGVSDLGALGLSRRSMRRGIRQGLIWSAGFGLLAGMGGLILFLLGMDPFRLIHVGLPQTWSGVVLFFVVGGVIAPIAEEIFFRGVIYGYLRGNVFKGMSHWGIWPAVVISTALFVMAHQVGAGIPLPQLVGGVVFCLAYEIEKSLFTPIIIHSLGNLALFTLSCF